MGIAYEFTKNRPITVPHYQFFVCNRKEFPYAYRQKIDNVTQLQIIDDKEDYRFFVGNVKDYQF